MPARLPVSYDDLLLDRQLCFALHAASRAVVRAYTPLLDELGLTYPQYVTMMVLWAAPRRALTVGELADAVQMDSGTLTPMLKRLERDGLVTRARDRDDERRVNVRLTDAGVALRERAVHVPRSMAARFGITREEGAQLQAQLERLTARLCDEPEPTPPTPAAS